MRRLILKLLRRRRLHHDLEQEIAFHREMAAAGNNPIPFGHTTNIMEQGLDLWRFTTFENLWRDVQYALRTLHKQWGFSLAATMTLTLGIGASTAIFSVVHSLLIEPLPYRDADRLVRLSAESPDGKAIALPYPDFLDFRRQSRSLAGLVAYQGYGFTLTGAGEAERLPGRTVSAGFFSTLGVTPILGRDFRESDDQPGAAAVVILSDRVWQRRFQADPAVVGRAATFNGQRFTVVGVLPSWFRFIESGEVFAPIGLGLRPHARGQRRGLHAIGRLRPGVTLQQARVEAGIVARHLAQQYPDSNARVGAQLIPLSESFVGPTKTVLLLLLATVSCLLLIACANIANLLLARAVARRREMAVRLALGASRLRLIHQMLTESCVLALLGGLGGVLLAAWSVQAINTLLPENIQRAKEVSVNSAALGFSALVSVGAGVLIGLVTAWHTVGREATGDVRATLKQSERASVSLGGRLSLSSTLVSLQVGLALVLLLGAGLLARTLLALVRVDPGFRAANVLRTQIVLPPEPYSPERQVSFFSELLERARVVPGVEAASLVMCLPLSGNCWAAPIEVEGRPVLTKGVESEVSFNAVAPDYFRTMGIPLLSGRDFDRRDDKNAPAVAIISSNLAQRYFGNQKPIGKRVRDSSSESDTGWLTIVGVVGDVRRYSLDTPGIAEVYRPVTQYPINFMTLVVHTAGDPLRLSSAVRANIKDLDPELPLLAVGTMEQLAAEGVAATRRLPALLLALFAGFALVLAAVGIHGVVAYSVSRRTGEIGIRMALGARRTDVWALVVRQGMRPVWLGAAVGTTLSGVLVPTISALLYGIEPSDALTWTAALGTVLGVALLACAVPAWRATGIDPVTAIRRE